MAARVEAPKTSPRQVAARALEGLRTGQNHVVADDAALDTRAALTADPAGVEAEMQKAWSKAPPLGPPEAVQDSRKPNMYAITGITG